MSFNTKIIGWVVLAVIIGSALYSLFLGGKEEATGQVQPNASASQNVGKEFLSLRNRLQNISFESDLFTNSLFTSLKDLSIQLPTPIIGRPNPFDRIGNDIGIAPQPKGSAVTPSQ